LKRARADDAEFERLLEEYVDRMKKFVKGGGVKYTFEESTNEEEKERLVVVNDDEEGHRIVLKLSIVDPPSESISVTSMEMV